MTTHGGPSGRIGTITTLLAGDLTAELRDAPDGGPRLFEICEHGRPVLVARDMDGEAERLIQWIGALEWRGLREVVLRTLVRAAPLLQRGRTEAGR